MTRKPTITRPPEPGRFTGRPWHILLAVGLALLFTAVLPCESRGDDIDAEIRLKTGFLFKFFQYIEWPDSAGDHATSDDVRIAVLGDSEFYHAIGELIPKIEGSASYHVVLKQLGDDLTGFDVVLVTLKSKVDCKAALDALRGSPTLTVSDGEGLAEAGVMINFTWQATDRGKKIRFEVNSKSAHDANLKIGAQLLKLAVNVVGPDGK